MRRAARRDDAFMSFRFHDLRHWFAVDYQRRGGNIYTLQKILGHGMNKRSTRGTKRGTGITVNSL